MPVETILVTGANSFIGGWIVKYLIEQGYHVRGTVRSKDKEAQVLDGLAEADRSHISFVYVPDITKDSFDEAVQGVDAIIHVASPFHFKVDDPEKDLLLPAINGTRGVLRSAHQYNQSAARKISRIVITSSFAAIIDPSFGMRAGYHYTEQDWCPLTYEQAAQTRDNPALVYRASKTCAERAAWDFIDQEKPSFTIATICEPLVFGPRMNGFHSSHDMNTSNAIVWSLLNLNQEGTIPETTLPMQIDVRDVARTHIAALQMYRERNDRYLICGSTWTHHQIVDLIHQNEQVPNEIRTQLPQPNKHYTLPDHFEIDSSKAQKDLGIQYTAFSQTIHDLVVQLVEFKQRSNA
jgi:nucleoside-diphosphate-sugar epimerase